MSLDGLHRRLAELDVSLEDLRTRHAELDASDRRLEKLLMRLVDAHEAELDAKDAEIDKVRAALEGARDLHGKPRTDRHGSGCIHCGIVWPCPTYKLTSAALDQPAKEGE